MYKLTITKMVNQNLTPRRYREEHIMTEVDAGFTIKVPEEKLTVTLTDEEFKTIKKAILEII